MELIAIIAVLAIGGIFFALRSRGGHSRYNDNDNERDRDNDNDRDDACHIACAIIAECDVFLTTDKRVLKYQPTNTNIRILNPATFLIEEDV